MDILSYKSKYYLGLHWTLKKVHEKILFCTKECTASRRYLSWIKQSKLETEDHYLCSVIDSSSTSYDRTSIALIKFISNKYISLVDHVRKLLNFELNFTIHYFWKGRYSITQPLICQVYESTSSKHITRD